MSDERCKVCKFWEHPTHQDDLHDDDKEGRCRRYPAVLIGHDVEERGWACQEASHWSQPVMYAGDWCGEFQRSAIGATPPRSE